jgi:hypothetical protein
LRSYRVPCDAYDDHLDQHRHALGGFALHFQPIQSLAGGTGPAYVGQDHLSRFSRGDPLHQPFRRAVDAVGAFDIEIAFPAPACKSRTGPVSRMLFWPFGAPG